LRVPLRRYTKRCRVADKGVVFKDSKRRLWLTVKVGMDAALAWVSFILAFWIRFHAGSAHPLDIIRGPLFAPYLYVLMFAPLIRVFCSFMVGLYDRKKRGVTRLDSMFAVIKAAALGSMVIVVFIFGYRGVFEFREFSYSRSVVLLDGLINFALVAMSRVVIGHLDAWLKGSGIGLKKALFVGYNPEVERLVRALSVPSSGCRVVGYVGEERPGALSVWLGPKERLVELLQSSSADEVYVLDSYFTQEELLEVSGWCDKLDTDLRIIPTLYMVMAKNAAVDEIAGIPTILVKKGGISGWDRILKEAEDYILSILILILLMPFMALTALIVVLDSPGPVFFRQVRVGKNGRHFRMFKFRSMVVDAEKVKERLMAANEAQGPIFKMKDDPRITNVGKFIRRTSIDELPQLINVIRGEMSLVGPRPPLPDEVSQYEEWQKERLAALPGITGLWQVSGRHALSFDEMVKWDIYYIRNWSLLLDMKILIKTLPAVIFTKGAY